MNKNQSKIKKLMSVLIISCGLGLTTNVVANADTATDNNASSSSVVADSSSSVANSESSSTATSSVVKPVKVKKRRLRS